MYKDGGEILIEQKGKKSLNKGKYLNGWENLKALLQVLNFFLF